MTTPVNKKIEILSSIITCFTIIAIVMILTLPKHRYYHTSVLPAKYRFVGCDGRPFDWELMDYNTVTGIPEVACSIEFK